MLESRADVPTARAPGRRGDDAERRSPEAYLKLGPDTPGGRSRRADRLALAVPFAVVTAALSIWELASRAGVISRLFYPPPSAVARALADLIASGALGRDLEASLLRIAGGFLLGGGVALVLGFAMGLFRTLRLAIDPLVAAAHPVPKLALLPLIFLVFGLGEAARVACVAVSCFFPMVINTTSGVRQIEPIYFEVARNFGARWPQLLRHVVLPGSLPAIAAGVRLALVGALRTTIGIELLAAPSGLGHRIWISWERFATAELYAALAVVAAVGFTLHWLLQQWVGRFQAARAGA